ncbi:MAG: hypothetical protein JTT11_02425 [Candidatus Brockarchaeota archaeon]|nr:hypothetical protein [Candidatus Brockarchaeota archaeon]
MGQAENYAVSATRVVVLHEGYVVVNDTFVLSSPGRLPKEFMVGVPKSLSRNAIRSPAYPYAVLDTGEKLAVEWSGAGEELWISVKLPDVVGKISLSVVQAFSDPVSVSPYGALVFSFPAVPLLKTGMESCYTEVWFDKRWSVVSSPENYAERTAGNSVVYSNNYGRQPAESNETATFVIVPLGEERYSVARASKIIDVDPFSGVTVTEWFKFMVESYSDSVPVFLFGNVSDISVRDDVGEFLPESASRVDRSTFKVSKHANGSITLVDVFPRYPVYPNQNFSIRVSYKILVENVTGLSAFGKTALFSLPKTTNFTSFANEYVIEVAFPIGAKLEGVKIGGLSLPNGLNSLNSYKTVISGATEEMFDSTITVAYSYDTFWAGYSPSVFIGLAFIAGLAYVLTKKEEVVGEVAAPAELESVRRFVERYREKLRIEEILERCKEDLRNNRITRQEYKARSRQYAARLEEINRTLPQLRSQASKLSRNAAKLIEGIEVSEAEMASMGSAIRDLDLQLSQRKISRAAHEKLIDNYAKRIRAEKTKIGAALNELDRLSSA